MVKGQYSDYIPPDEEFNDSAQAPPSYTPSTYADGFDSGHSAGESSASTGETTIPTITSVSSYYYYYYSQ
jgi:hypothetical protein